MGTELHPLQNHLILTHIASLLRFKELKTFRLVCKQWNSASRPRLINKSCVIFKDDGGRTRIRKFLKDNIETFVSFRFVRLDIRSKYEKILEFFVEQLGHIAKEMTFVNCRLDYGKVVNGFPNLVVLSIAMPGPPGEYEDEEELAVTELQVNPNLKCLEITGNVGEEDGDGLVDWNYFIAPFPKIEALGAHCRSSEDLTQLVSLLHTTPSKLPSLADFSCILTDLHNSHIELLSQTDFQLRSIDISIAESTDSSVIESLLKLHAPTLKNLKMFRDSEQPLGLLSSPKWSTSFKLLSSIDLQCNMVQSLDFLKYLPAVRTLNLTQFGDAEVSFNNSIVRSTKQDLIAPSVRHFSFEYYLAPDSMERVIGIFPNMTRLSVYLIDETIRVVFRDGKNLQELVVFGTQLTDEGITGVPMHLLERNYKFMKDYRKLPYIADLKKLWRFSLYPQPQERVTDYSVDYGFMDSSSLTCIEVPETAISNEGIEKLQSKINLLTLTSPFICEDGMVFSRPSFLQSLQ